MHPAQSHRENKRKKATNYSSFSFKKLKSTDFVGGFQLFYI